MKKISSFKSKIILVFLFLFLNQSSFAQFTFNGQLVNRFEYRHGYGKLIEKNVDPAAFMSQRSRIEGTYKLPKLTFHTSLQDIRTWGATAQTRKADNYFAVYEAWAQVHFDSSLSLKIGVQELNYDNARFLGNIDWALQGRAHDFALLKYAKNKTKIDLGAGFNQDGESLTGNIYSSLNPYKTAQMLRLEHAMNNFDFSFLFWNNGKQFTLRDSTNKIVKKEVHFSQTIGLPTIRYKMNNTTIQVFYYQQLGKDVNNKDINAYNANLQVSHVLKFNETKKSQLKITLGTEIISGTDNNNSKNETNSYNPMFGTNHMHNGYMDYFFVAGRFENSVGLMDTYLKFKYDFSSKGFVALNGHLFQAQAKVYNSTGKMDSNLGTEIDYAMGYVINKYVSVQLGYSHMINSKTFEYLNDAANPNDLQNWAYLMLIVRPDSDKKFIAIYN